MNTQEFEAADPFHIYPIDVNGGVCTASGVPEVHTEFFGFLSVEGQVVPAPHITRCWTFSL